MADALASGASVRKDVGVQVPPRAPKSQSIQKKYLKKWFHDLSQEQPLVA
jgi:hypothetical protein